MTVILVVGPPSKKYNTNNLVSILKFSPFLEFLVNERLKWVISFLLSIKLYDRLKVRCDSYISTDIGTNLLLPSFLLSTTLNWHMPIPV